MLGDITLKDLSDNIEQDLPLWNLQTDNLLAIFTSNLYPSEREEYATRIFHLHSSQAQYLRFRSYFALLCSLTLILMAIIVCLKLLARLQVKSSCFLKIRNLWRNKE